MDRKFIGCIKNITFRYCNTKDFAYTNWPPLKYNAYIRQSMNFRLRAGFLIIIIVYSTLIHNSLTLMQNILAYLSNLRFTCQLMYTDISMTWCRITFKVSPNKEALSFLLCSRIRKLKNCFILFRQQTIKRCVNKTQTSSSKWVH